MIPPEAALCVAIALSCLAFARYRGSTALIGSFVIGYLLLPAAAAVNLPGLPPVDKDMSIWLGAITGTLLFQPQALRGFKWHPADLILLAIIPSTLYTSLSNGLGSWDGISSAGRFILLCVLPYMLGRVHLRQPADLVSLGKAMFWGGLMCAPLAIWEFRMSPQLHNTVYGYFPHSFAQQFRWGFFRPVLFLGHGLAVASYFGTSLLLGIILLKYRVLQLHLARHAVLAVLCVGMGLAVTMSVAPWGAVIISWLLFALSRRRRWVPVAAALPGVIWVVLVFTADLKWDSLSMPFRSIGAEDRAESLQYRLDAMEEYSEGIRKKPWWGYGGWGRGRIETRATDSEALAYMLAYGIMGAGARYLWYFLVVAAMIGASKRMPHPVQRDLFLLFACLMGIYITSSILGTAACFLPVSLIGGAATGLIVASSSSRRQATRGGFPVQFAGESRPDDPRRGTAGAEDKPKQTEPGPTTTLSNRGRWVHHGL